MFSRHVLKTVNGRNCVYTRLSCLHRRRVRRVYKFVGVLDDVDLDRRRRWI